MGLGKRDQGESTCNFNLSRAGHVLQDRVFESVASYSLPAHLYMLAAQSGGYVGGAGQPRPTTITSPKLQNC